MTLPRGMRGSDCARLLTSILLLLLPPCALRAQQDIHAPPTGLPEEKTIHVKPVAPPWPPSEYPIGMWCSPPEPFITFDQYRRIADCGINMVLPPCEGEATVARNKKILDLAHRTGLYVIVQDSRMPLSITGTPGAEAAIKAIVAEYRHAPSLLGYFITDEPGASKFAGLAEVVAELNKLDPVHPAYINLFPNYASTDLQANPSQLNTETYQQYVDRYMQTVRPAMVSYDHYHMTVKGDLPGFFGNLSVMQHAALSTTPQTPFWNIVQSLRYQDRRALNENEMRYQAMQTLAYGGKGLLYFTYWTPQSSPDFPCDSGIMNRDGTPGALYEAVKHVDIEVKRLGHWLLRAAPIRTFQTGDVPPDGRAQSNDLPVSAVGDANLTIGAFRGQGGFFMALVTNRDYKSGVTAVIHADAGKRVIQELDVATNKWKQVTGTVDADGITALTFQLPPAGAVLIRWE
jgi:hypothetical protein